MFVFTQKQCLKIYVLNLKNSDKKCKIFKKLCLYEFKYMENSQAIFMSLYKKNKLIFNAYEIQEFVIINCDH